ncbi:MAG: DNA ligase (NAD+), partial [Bradymonadia bacterium]
QAAVVELGGTKASGVSKTLSYLVVGNAGKAGSKLTKAEKAGVPVLSEDDFAKILAEARSTSE